MQKENTTINGIDAQHLTIQCLTKLSERESILIIDKIEKNPAYSEAIKEQLYLCAGTAGELKKDANADTFENICKTILKRQRNKKSVLKKDYREALGLHNNMELSRIEKGEVIIKKEYIDNICNGFEENGKRCFWRNQLLYLYPSVNDFQGQQSDIEYQCLEAVCKAMLPKQYDRMYAELNELEQMQMDSVFKDTDKADLEKKHSKMGKPPYELYTIIAERVKAIDSSIAKIAEEELEITTNTWYLWRKTWMEAEQNGFADGIPKPGLSRVQMLLLAVLFDFTYFEAVLFLALGGYRFSSGEPDEKVIHYLKHKDIKSENVTDTNMQLEMKAEPRVESFEEIKNYLKEGIYDNVWRKR